MFQRVLLQGSENTNNFSRGLVEFTRHCKRSAGKEINNDCCRREMSRLDSELTPTAYGTQARGRIRDSV